MSLVLSALIPLECLLPSLNASSLLECIFPLECLFKPEGRAWAAGGGPVASIEKVF